MARPHDSDELAKIITAYGITGVIGRQVARDDVRAEARAAEQRAVYVLDDFWTGRAEILTAIQVCSLIVFYGEIVRREEVGIVPEQIFVYRVGPLATVAVRLRVDDKASQSKQILIFALLVDEVWRDA